MSDITNGRVAWARPTLRHRLALALHAIDRAVVHWASRRRLADLDDHMLKDLGISRAQAQFEASRPVWDQNH
jgi:uncharacterized protein YjiS (DUF1127 family)